MRGSETKEQCRLESAVEAAQAAFDAAIQEGSGDLIELRVRVNATRKALARWGSQILQVLSPPSGMIAVFERRDGLEEYIPVSYLGLTRSGRVLPYLLLGNCESKLPTDYPNFLRIDHAQVMAKETAFELIGTELAPDDTSG